jgi:hypothetical protein
VPTLAQMYPELYANGKTPALKEFLERVFSDLGLSGNEDVIAALVETVKQYISEGGT